MRPVLSGTDAIEAFEAMSFGDDISTTNDVGPTRIDVVPLARDPVYGQGVTVWHCLTIAEREAHLVQRLTINTARGFN